MNEARIERLTREALGPRRRAYTKLDDTVLRAVGIAILIATVITFASWPRGEEPRSASKASGPVESSIVPTYAGTDEARSSTRTTESAPTY
jgi:hypothetical protein